MVDPRNGRTMSAGLDSYYLPVHADIPADRGRLAQRTGQEHALGIIGLGKVSMTGVAATIANAVYHATGRRVRDLPISLDKAL